MRNTLTAITALTAVAITTSAYAQTGHPYNPMNQGQTITYARYNILGTWDDASMKLSVTHRRYIDTVTVKITKKTCPQYFGQGPLFSTDFPDGNSLQDGGTQSSNGITYIGEAINQFGNVHFPFIAKIAFNPVAGQVIEAQSLVRTSCANSTPINGGQLFHWKYRTIEHLPTWGAFTDSWRTGLREYGFPNSGPSQVYNYVFQRGKGQVDLWHGALQPDGRTVGSAATFNMPVNQHNAWEYYAIR